MKTVWDDLFDEEKLADINEKLRNAQRVADRQAFGLILDARSQEFLRIMRSARSDIDMIIKRVEEVKKEGK